MPQWIDIKANRNFEANEKGYITFKFSDGRVNSIEMYLFYDLTLLHGDLITHWLKESETNPSTTEIEEAERRAFNAARETDLVNDMGHRYEGFEDYKASKTSK